MGTGGLPHGEFGTMLNYISDPSGMSQTQSIVLLKPGEDIFIFC